MVNYRILEIIGNYKTHTEEVLCEIVIPFTKFFKREDSKDIYYGFEKIQFRERNPAYKIIFHEEFQNLL